VRGATTPRGVAVLLVAVVAAGGCTGEAGRGEARGPIGQPSGAPTSTPQPAPTPEPRPTTRPTTRSTAPTATVSREPSREEPDTDEPSATPAGRDPGPNPQVSRIPDRQWRRMVETGVWRPECPARRRDLRRVRIDHVGFDGDVHRGTLVVNEDITASIVRVFTRLFEERFPIRKMRPVEVYGGDVNASLAADNTSAYNCRQLDQINAPVLESPHANGRAIDINPVENPWVDLRCDCWLPGREHRRRTPGKGKILRGGLVWRVFVDEGWIWQNIDVPDYMHFDTGYPSRVYRGPEANKRWHERQRRREQRQERREERRQDAS
jgi:hypothetical protein